MSGTQKNHIIVFQMEKKDYQTRTQENIAAGVIAIQILMATALAVTVLTSKEIHQVRHKREAYHNDLVNKIPNLITSIKATEDK